MLHQKLINPKSIAVIGASNNIDTPGGNVFKNLISHNFKGQLFPVNPKETIVQGVKCFQQVSNIPNVDVAIIAISAKFTLETVQILAQQKNTKGFIIFSAGFSETSAEGKLLEQKIVIEINNVGGTLLGPNNIGIINQNYTGVFTSPIPKLNPKGVDFISGSGATAVFIMEASIASGLTFSSVYSVGNSAQTGAEEVLEHLDQTFDASTSSKVKLLYIESIHNPQKLLKHAKSLIKKGCKIAAIKAGTSKAGSRAASSHTGALVSSDIAINALFKKAGIIRCYSKNELLTVASVLLYPELKGANIAIITHAGGPAVMLTDTLEKNGLQVPEIKNSAKKTLLNQLFAGSSVSNPIDFLATGTAEQLGIIIDFCEYKFSKIDAMVVIFGSPGLFNVSEVYKILNQKIKECKKPIYPILPSVENAKNEIDEFINYGNINFPDEVIFGNALATVYNTTKIIVSNDLYITSNEKIIRTVIDKCENGYLHPTKVKELLIAANIPIVNEIICYTKKDCLSIAKQIGFPLALKVVGPIHKSDVGGIVLNISSQKKLLNSFEKIMKIEGVTSALLQPMKKGTELFIGVKKEDNFGHLILCGLGGIFIEVIKDIQTNLCPVSKTEAFHMIKSLKSYKIFQGIRNQESINEDIFAEIISRVSKLVEIAPEIAELDLNPLLGNSQEIMAVDARIRIEKTTKFE